MASTLPLNYPQRDGCVAAWVPAQTGQIKICSACGNYFGGEYCLCNKTKVLESKGWASPTPIINPEDKITVEGYPSSGVSTKDSEGYPDNNPKTAFGAKKLPLELVPPSAVAALAEAFADGAKKYGPYNWRDKSISSSVYYGAALRHLSAWWDGEDYAPDSGIHHLHHALACIALIIDGASVDKLNDNRPPKGAAGKMQKAWLEKS